MITPIRSRPLPAWWPGDRAVARIMRALLPYHRFISLRYKLHLLQALARLWPDTAGNVLDIGVGDGMLATVIQRIFPCRDLTGVDIVNRLHPAATIECEVFDGINLPFDNARFDVILLCNVLHHVPTTMRQALMHSIAACASGRLLIKDHLASGRLSEWSLHLADWIGNQPFNAMSSAEYFDREAWRCFLSRFCSEWEIFGRLEIQGGWRRLVFPDRQEIIIACRPGATRVDSAS